MVSASNVKFFYRSIWVNLVLCVLLMLINTSAYGVSYKYVIYSDDTEGTPKNRHYYLYAPSSLASGTYICRYNPDYINTASTLNLKSYPIIVKYVYHLDNPADDHVDAAAYLRISNCNASGEIIIGTTNTISISQGATTSGYLIVNPNEGLLFDFFTGDWYWRSPIGEHKHRSFTGTVEITFQLDEAPPDAPVLRINNIGTSGVVNLGAKIYAKNPVILQWDTPADNATVLADQTMIGPGAIVSYKLDTINENI